MKILGKDLIEEFQLKHPQSRSPLDEWVGVIEAGAWQHLIELKESFRSVDYVKGYLIFNIKGNDFRLVAVAVFRNQKVSVVHIFTHAEYDHWCKNVSELKRKA